MNLFLETPQRAAERLLREQRRQYSAPPAASGWNGSAASPPQSSAAPMTPRTDASAYDQPRTAHGGGQAPAAAASAYAAPPAPQASMPQGGAPAVPGAPQAAYPAAGPAGPGPQATPAAYRASAQSAPVYPEQRPSQQPWNQYSLAQETYREERAYDRQRARRRKRHGALRIVGMFILVPLMLVAAFLVSYILTCIINGASPDDVAGLLANLWERIRGWFLGITVFG